MHVQGTPCLAIGFYNVVAKASLCCKPHNQKFCHRIQHETKKSVMVVCDLGPRTVIVNFGTQTELLRFDINQFKDKDSDIAFYTGSPIIKH